MIKGRKHYGKRGKHMLSADKIYINTEIYALFRVENIMENGKNTCYQHCTHYFLHLQ